MIVNKCSVCDECAPLKLSPDYTASGFWCGNCGVAYGNPKVTFPLIPEEIVNLIEGWVWLWEFAADELETEREHFETIFRSMGKELAKQVSRYYDCFYDEYEKVFYK